MALTDAQIEEARTVARTLRWAASHVSVLEPWADADEGTDKSDWPSTWLAEGAADLEWVLSLPAPHLGEHDCCPLCKHHYCDSACPLHKLREQLQALSSCGEQSNIRDKRSP